ncbi:GAF domain-containing protein [Ornithobacterium rhinotracheale]|uniref:GAF domain-containing protein n=1 Tax=Ornithobacterium rhinotracheale TaxID=28251 RepID=UPI001FF69BE9|nr:GAF domain-containing protein [Ornithobacterium rhinotracheale]MCK0200466.1 GAF domain-containing protein [Ornithobacterium rhinotracheale]UVD87810.1 GAF domain-containing protein [Ornithobacterium rhinotracheale]
MSDLKKRIDTIFEANQELDSTLQKICKLLYDEVKHFNWVGFYFKNGDKQELKLGSYEGAPTEHTIIPYGKGICGQVAVSNETFISQDVYAEENYLACSIETKAEIVVPIFKNGENVGQIDIDSHYANSISKEDKELLNYICERVGKML